MIRLLLRACQAAIGAALAVVYFLIMLGAAFALATLFLNGITP